MHCSWHAGSGQTRAVLLEFCACGYDLARRLAPACASIWQRWRQDVRAACRFTACAENQL